ncbi:MAG: ribosomal RNA small subunit methyltransferase A [Dehalococcoidia bacterium]|nr:ribosomal RNA small subunit methyltransferase A [Dehalococcoidia bacterium]
MVLADADLSDPQTIGALLSQYGIWLDREQSQHLLAERNILDRIVAAAAVRSTDRVLEIGAGIGTLTRELVARAGEVIAVEIDERLVEVLAATCPAANLRVIHQDILALDIERYFGAQPYRLVANLPYSVATPAILRLLQASHPPQDLLVMVQREVGERLAARPGNMSLLSVKAQLFADVELVSRVPPQAFFPPPKVAGAVVHLVPRPTPQVPLLPTEARFWQTVEAGFATRRKQLHNALGSLGVGTEPIHTALAAVGIDPSQRAQTLTLADWSRLSAALWA